jgi:mono/diheme cytochrome c family protein
MRRLLICTLALLLATDFGRAAEKSDEGVRLAEQVRDIFVAKCVDCHGPDLPRPKGKFGYVLDLKRVSANPDYIVRGHPADSELFKMVRDNEMPGEDAKVPALTAAEVEAVRRWIALGAPEPATPLDTRKVAPAVAAGAPAAEPRTQMPTGKRALQWVGRFHPVSTHFPVALMLVAVLAEGLAWWTRRESWQQTVRFLVIIAALGAVAAGVLGWINASFTSYTGQNAAILTWHRWLGTGTAVWAVVCAALAVMDE